MDRSLTKNKFRVRVYNRSVIKMIKYIILILLLSGCTKDLDIDPMSTILKHTYKVITKGESND